MATPLRLDFRPWVIRGGRLHSPRSFVLGTAWLFLLPCAAIIEGVHSGHHPAWEWLLVLAIFFAFVIIAALEWRRWGALGKPHIEVNADSIVCGPQAVASSKHLKTALYPDDVVYVVGPQKTRFIRLVGPSAEERTISLWGARGGTDRYRRFIVNRLRKRHRVVIGEPPTFFEEVRGDY